MVHLYLMLCFRFAASHAVTQNFRKCPVDPVMLVHGGAWAIPDEAVDAHLRGVEAAVAGLVADCSTWRELP